MKMMKLLSVLIVGIVLVSCSEYNKVLKSDDYQQKFDMANEMFDKGQYDRSISLYEQVYQRFPKESQGEVSYFRIGKAYYLYGDYDMGGYYLGAFSQRYPYSPKVEEAMFLSATSSVNNSPEVSLDQTATEVAINDLQQFIDRFPNSELVDSCNNIIDRLRFKLETKEYEAVKLYAKTENYRAAVTTAETFYENYPMSDYKEEVGYLLVTNSSKLAMNSIESKKKDRIEETLERYRNFVSEFPNTSYKRDVNLVSDLMNRELQKINLENK